MGAASSAFKSTVGTVFGSVGVETPKHEVLREILSAQNDGVTAEIRRYPSGVGVQISVSSTYDESDSAEPPSDAEYRSTAFRTLAAYIGVLSAPQNRSRSNDAAEPVAMTAPVVMDSRTEGEPIAMTAPVVMQQREATLPAEGEPVAMTAPVVMQQRGEDALGPDSSKKEQAATSKTITRSMMFILPSKYTMETAPVPTDPRVKLVEVPARTVAAMTFPGRWTLSNVHPKAQELFELLDENSIEYNKEEWSFAGYNPPWTLNFLRTNEIFVSVTHEPAADASTSEQCATGTVLDET